MLAIFLVLIAFTGGAAITYSVMNGPRGETERQLRVLTRQRHELEDERDALSVRAADLDARQEILRKAVEGQRERAAQLHERTAEFKARAIQYDDLATENRLLKADLRNLLLRLARHDFGKEETARHQMALAEQRDRLAAAYLDEVRAAVRRTLSPTNYAAVKGRLRSAYSRVREEGGSAPERDEREALRDLHNVYEKQVRAAVEREKQATVRETIREEARRERESAEAIRRAEQERRAVEVALAKALAEAGGRHAAEVDRLQAQLAEAEAKIQRTISLAEITRSGNVYVISNIGSFGRDVFKIGMTRRLDPLDRVAELGSASVPFPFDVHVMIETDDAPKLENALHREFHTRRVNRANPRKEFFRVTIDEIVTAVQKHHGTVTYTADPEAAEFYASESMTDADLTEVEQVYSDAGESDAIALPDDSGADDPSGRGDEY